MQTIQQSTKIATTLKFVISFFVVVFLGGVAYAKFEGRVDNNETNISENALEIKGITGVLHEIKEELSASNATLIQIEKNQR